MDDTVLTQEEIEALLRKSEQELPKMPDLESTEDEVFSETPSLETPLSSGETFSNAYLQQLEALGDLELDVCIELGQTRMRLQDVAMLRRGSVVVLDRHVDDLINVLVNGQRVARGRLLVVDGRFAVQLVEFV